MSRPYRRSSADYSARPRRRRATLLTLLALWVTVAGVAAAQRPSFDKATLALAEDRSAYPAGSTARIAAVVSIDDTWHLQSNTPTFDYLIPTVLTVDLPGQWAELSVDYPPHSLFTFEFEDEPLAVYEGDIHILATLQVPADAEVGPHVISASLRYQACDDRQCLPPTTAEAEIVLTVGDDGEASNEQFFAEQRPLFAEEGGSQRRSPTSATGFLGILLFGLLGGLILNAMPCVLPVLSIKLFGLVEQAAKGRRATTVGALATASGIIVSFWALALAAVLARGAGQLIGWGIQFQNPAFVTFMVIVVVLFCLNLWGLFEIPLPGRLATAASGGRREGIAGHFATGLFATLMATPCSAPFLGSAIGFALSQSDAVIFAIFTAVGVGMSLPYLTLAAAPGSMSWLPKPGEWMLRLKVVMGFLLAGAAVWLLYVLAAQIRAEQLAFIEVGVLVLSLFVWMTQLKFKRAFGKRFAYAGLLAAIVGMFSISLNAEPPAASGVEQSSGLIAWTTFSRSEAESLAREGRLVFVDVTADWCFTCKANERLVLHTQAVADAFERHGVIPMQADWTNRSDEIAQYLADYGRYSVPFYMLYRPGAEPHLFGEILRKKEILRVLEESVASSVQQVAAD